MKDRIALRLAGLSVVSTLFVSPLAAGITVDEFLPDVGPRVADEWYLTDMRHNGTATIEDLSGLGGNLETAQPLPTGAAKLTTSENLPDKAEVGTFGDFGLFSDLARDGNILFSYYKAYVTSTNPAAAFAAPALKLEIKAPDVTGHDHYMQLVYEPTWNQPSAPGSSLLVPTDQWITANITATSGLWWTTGGFGFPNSQSPLHTLSDWMTAFTGQDADIASAHVTGISVGVGSWNQDQIGYFDNISYTAGNVSKAYDFEPGVAVPEPSVLLFGLTGLALGGLVLRRRRR